MITRNMVLFPTEDQFNEKTNELMIESCYWTISVYPKNKEQFIGSKIYFYDKTLNIICLRATIQDFDEVDGKKAVYFNMKDHNDWAFRLNLNLLKIPKRKQTRGWTYRWWQETITCKNCKKSYEAIDYAEEVIQCPYCHYSITKNYSNNPKGEIEEFIDESEKNE